jgi:hypothetical protein
MMCHEDFDLDGKLSSFFSELGDMRTSVVASLKDLIKVDSQGNIQHSDADHEGNLK